MFRKSYNLIDASDKVMSDLPKKEKAFIQFKDRIKNHLNSGEFRHSDYFLKKWLIARQYNVDAAVQMFLNSETYRERIGSNEILETFTPPEVIHKYLTGGIVGKDKEGSPLRVELYGHLDLKGLMHSCRKMDLERAKIFECETIVKNLKESYEKTGNYVDGMTVIFDLAEVGSNVLWRPGLNMYLHLVKILEDNYPEMLKRMFVINAPVIFPILWKICKPMISEDMKKKIFVLGNDYQKVLLSYIDANELPGFLGGSKTDPDGNPRCQTWIGQGGKIPESYYNSDLSNVENLQEVIVPRGDKIQLNYEVRSLNCVLTWEFKTEDYDLGYGLTFRKEKDEPEKVLIPVTRVNCHMVPENDSHCCQEVGIYSVIFDNSFSIARSKQIKYRIELVESDNDSIRETSQLRLS